MASVAGLTFPQLTARFAVRRAPRSIEGSGVMTRLWLTASGVLPVSLISAAAFDVAALRETATHLLVPVMTITLLVMLRSRTVRRLIVVTLGIGIVATALYDVFRFGFLALGLMPDDPIPHIGQALDLHPAWVYGYLWRYVGNGGGLAIAFMALGFSGVRAGILYGLFVCSGLMVTLAFSPLGQSMLFELNLTTAVMAIGGHAIYGLVLGSLTGRFLSRALSTYQRPGSLWLPRFRAGTGVKTPRDPEAPPAMVSDCRSAWTVPLTPLTPTAFNPLSGSTPMTAPAASLRAVSESGDGSAISGLVSPSPATGHDDVRRDTFIRVPHRQSANG